MKIPEKINSQWIATLGDEQLVTAESALHALFFKEETAEKKRSGRLYAMMEGPATLVDAWHRWLLVNNETRYRGLAVSHGARKTLDS